MSARARWIRTRITYILNYYRSVYLIFNIACVIYNEFVYRLWYLYLYISLIFYLGTIAAESDARVYIGI